MKRRTFAKLAAVPFTLGAAHDAWPDAVMTPPPPRAGRIKLGHQHWSDDASLRLLAALGVTHICSAVPSARFDENWSIEGLDTLRKRVESFGIRLEAVPLPLSSTYITKAENPDIMLGKSPDRDHEIENICQMIRNCGRAGIPMVKYNLTILGVVRSSSTPGRGGAKYSTFRYNEAKQDTPLTEAGPVSADEMWARITYFLERVVPVAEEAKVRMACHPHDPGMPEKEGFRGVHRVLGSVDGLKRFVEIHPSAYHGLNFCQGSVCEMLRDPNREIHDVIRYFGSRKKIFNVHFRNIRGGFLDFRETFPDAGDVDLVAALRTYQSIGYDGMLMPDHAPVIDGDEGGRRAFSFAFGYIRGLLDVVQGDAARREAVKA